MHRKGAPSKYLDNWDLFLKDCFSRVKEQFLNSLQLKQLNSNNLLQKQSEGLTPASSKETAWSQRGQAKGYSPGFHRTSPIPK